MDIRKTSMTFVKSILSRWPSRFFYILVILSFSPKNIIKEKNTGVYCFHWIFPHDIFYLLHFSLWNLPQRSRLQINILIREVMLVLRSNIFFLILTLITFRSSSWNSHVPLF